MCLEINKFMSARDFETSLISFSLHTLGVITGIIEGKKSVEHRQINVL